jgi:hypothetical protein
MSQRVEMKYHGAIEFTRTPDDVCEMRLRLP